MAQHVCLKNTPAIKLRYNIAPGQMVLTIVQSETSEREGVMKKWGLIPSWAQDEKVAYKMPNARGETVAEKRSYRASLGSEVKR